MHADASFGMENTDQKAFTHQNAKIAAGGTLATVSGKDTSIQGANLTAKDIDMLVGGNLLVASQQDYAKSTSQSVSLGGSATVGYGASFEVTNAGVGGGLGLGNSSSKSLMVGEQTTILGTNSVNIYTEKNTHVAGAVVAALNDNLKLDTGTLSYESLYGQKEDKS